ncbi:MAG: hypothetical protein U0Y68_24235 [Blastocatellia bacterium]
MAPSLPTATMPDAASRINRSHLRKLSSAEALLLAAQAGQGHGDDAATNGQSRNGTRYRVWCSAGGCDRSFRLVYFPLSSTSLQLAAEFRSGCGDAGCLSGGN